MREMRRSAQRGVSVELRRTVAQVESARMVIVEAVEAEIVVVVVVFVVVVNARVRAA